MAARLRVFGHADRHHVARRQLEADLEEQQDRAELGEDGEGLARLEPGEAGPADEREVTEHDAEEELAEDRGLTEALGERAEEPGPDEDEGERGEDPGVLVVAGPGGEEDGQEGHAPMLPAPPRRRGLVHSMPSAGSRHAANENGREPAAAGSRLRSTARATARPKRTAARSIAT